MEEEEQVNEPGEASTSRDSQTSDMDVNWLCALTGDMQSAKELGDWGDRVNNKSESRNWDDNVKKMNDMLAKLGLSAPVNEVYSPRRVNAIAEQLGLISGSSLDLTVNDTDGEPWDFNAKERGTNCLFLGFLGFVKKSPS